MSIFAQNVNCVLETAPTISIVSTETAKQYIKSDNDEDLEDELVEIFISGAVGKIEQELGGVALAQQTWKQTQTGNCEYIKLFRLPIIEISEIKYYETFESEGETIDTNDYRIIQPNKIIHKDGRFKGGRDKNAYEITFDCGLFTASNYTDINNNKLNALKTAILRTVSWMNEQRTEFQSGSMEGDWSTQYNQQILGRLLPIGIKHLIMPFHSGEGLI